MNKIDYMVQIFPQNIIQVHYKSGADRFIYCNEWGQYAPNMAKTQLEFYRNAHVVDHRGVNRDLRYWYSENSRYYSWFESIAREV